MKIALASRFAWPNVGGTETLIRELATQYAAAGDEVVGLAHRVDQDGVEWHGPLDRGPAFDPVVDPINGVTTTQLQIGPLTAKLLGLIALSGDRRQAFNRAHVELSSRAFARQLEGVDVMHRFAGNRMAHALVDAAHRVDAAAVVTPLAHPGQWDADPVSARAYRAADAVVATSRADARTYERLGVGSDRLHICPLPTRASRSGGGDELRAREGLEGPIVLFLGGRRAYKGHDRLLEAGRIVRRRMPKSRLVFVGPGSPLDPEDGGVIDAGQVDDELRDAWLDAADVLCLPSSAESFGLAVSEAWSTATPVVTSDIPVLKERVAEAGGGLFSSTEPRPLADAITELLSDDGLRARMGAAGYAYWQERCSPESVGGWHRSLFEALLSA